MLDRDTFIDGAHERLVILGSGPAGYTAAIYAARASLRPLVISGMQTGGQLTITTDVENYPGFAEVVQGPWLMEQMKAQAEHVGTRMLVDLVASVDLSRRPFALNLESGGTITCDALIIATGAQARWLGLASEERRLRRFGMRHLRRVLLPGKACSGRRGRQHGRGGRALSVAHRIAGHARSSARHAAGRAHPAGPAA